MDDEHILRPLEFVGSSTKSLSSFPEAVKQDMGHALFVAQRGGRAPGVKTLKGYGGGVVEIIEDYDGGATDAFIRPDSDMRSMCCMRFRRNPNMEYRRRNMRSTSSRSS